MAGGAVEIEIPAIEWSGVEVDTYYLGCFSLLLVEDFFLLWGGDPKMISCNPPVIKLNKLVTDTTAVSKNARCRYSINLRTS